ncbi:MAG: hypothetical protein ACRDSP_08800 [Pseudonocardiaceae bacterium]
MTDAMPAYEPRYYERAGQRHMARYLQTRLFINVPWGLSGNPASRPEIDAVAELDRRVMPIEIKSYVLDVADVEAVVAKYSRLGFRQLIIVAPGLSDQAARSMTKETILKEFVVFRPDPEEISDWYDRVWPKHVPDWVHIALSSGRHHIRFVLSRATVQGRFVVGQQRCRVYRAETVSRLLRNLPSPPVRILWTPLRFTIPRDVIARRSQLTTLDGFVPVDIDGDRLHRALHACELTPGTNFCRFCLKYAEQEFHRLCDRLAMQPVDVLSSGGRGVHIYYHDDGLIRTTLLGLANRRAIRIDENVTASTKATVALPGSLHAGSLRPVASMIVQSGSHEVATCS